MSFARGTGSGGDNQQAASDHTASVMKAPGGVALLVLLGLGMAVTVLGVTGYVAKGIVLLLTGLLIAIAARQAHPEESTGLDGGLRALRDQPFGVYLLAAVGAGLNSYGAYMIVRARLAKMNL